MEEFKNKLMELSKRIELSMDNIKTEEATKMSYIVPFFQILEYDVYNPLEFIPEFTADVGIKKNEKVDYAIMIDNKPIILVEAKCCHENLEKHNDQLYRYFSVTESKFGVLTNGIIYNFYTDLEEQNKMDAKPFLTIDMLHLKDNTIAELSKFKKENFDLDAILNTAEELKYSNSIIKLLSSLLDNPTDEFTKYIMTEIYDGVRTQSAIDKFTPILKKSFKIFINDIVNSRLKNALDTSVSTTEPTIEDTTITPVEPKSKIVTTDEELDSFYIIKGMLSEFIDPSRIRYKDTESYFGILVDGNIRKWICRIYLSDKRKKVIIKKADSSEAHYIESLSDLYKLKSELIESLNTYIQE